MWNKFYDSVDGIDFDKKGGIRMTIRQFINAEIEKLREKTKETTAALAILDNPNSSVAEKTRVMRFLFVANQALWAELFELTKPTNRKKVSVASSVVPKLGPTKPVVTTAPAKSSTVLGRQVVWRTTLSSASFEVLWAKRALDWSIGIVAGKSQPQCCRGSSSAKRPTGGFLLRK